MNLNYDEGVLNKSMILLFRYPQKSFALLGALDFLRHGLIFRLIRGLIVGKIVGKNTYPANSRKKERKKERKSPSRVYIKKAMRDL